MTALMPEQATAVQRIRDIRAVAQYARLKFFTMKCENPRTGVRHQLLMRPWGDEDMPVMACDPRIIADLSSRMWMVHDYAPNPVTCQHCRRTPAFLRQDAELSISEYAAQIERERARNLAEAEERGMLFDVA